MAKPREPISTQTGHSRAFTVTLNLTSDGVWSWVRRCNAKGIAPYARYAYLRTIGCLSNKPTKATARLSYGKIELPVRRDMSQEAKDRLESDKSACGHITSCGGYSPLLRVRFSSEPCRGPVACHRDALENAFDMTIRK